MSCCRKLRTICWDAPEGKTPQEKYMHYRWTSLCVVLWWLLYAWFADVININSSSPILGVLIVKQIFWALAGILICMIIWAPPVADSDERKRRKVTITALMLFLVPALIFSFVTARSLINIENGIDFDQILQVEAALQTVYIYLIATGVGIAAGAQTMPVALRNLSVDDSEKLFAITTVIGFGTRFASYFLFAQIWSFIDPAAVIYIIIWHMLYLMNAYAVYVKKTWLNWVCRVGYAIVIIVIISRCTQLAPPWLQEIIGGIAGWYITRILIVWLGGLIPVYITGTLLRLTLLQLFIPIDPPSSDDVELLKTTV